MDNIIYNAEKIYLKTGQTLTDCTFYFMRDKFIVLVSKKNVDGLWLNTDIILKIEGVKEME